MAGRVKPRPQSLRSQRLLDRLNSRSDGPDPRAQMTNTLETYRQKSRRFTFVMCTDGVQIYSSTHLNINICERCHRPLIRYVFTNILSLTLVVKNEHVETSTRRRCGRSGVKERPGTIMGKSREYSTE